MLGEWQSRRAHLDRRPIAIGVDLRFVTCLILGLGTHRLRAGEKTVKETAAELSGHHKK